MSTVEGAGVYPALENRPLKDTICLFDVDNTLTPARRVSLRNAICILILFGVLSANTLLQFTACHR